MIWTNLRMGSRVFTIAVSLVQPKVRPAIVMPNRVAGRVVQRFHKPPRTSRIEQIPLSTRYRGDVRRTCMSANLVVFQTPLVSSSNTRANNCQDPRTHVSFRNARRGMNASHIPERTRRNRLFIRSLRMQENRLVTHRHTNGAFLSTRT